MLAGWFVSVSVSVVLKKTFIRILSAAAVFGFCTAAVPGETIAETLVLQGSTTFNRNIIEFHKAAIEAKTGHRITVIPNRSVLGMVALLENRAQMAMISSPLRSEIQNLKKYSGSADISQFKAFEISSTRVAFAVHPSNPVRKASLEKIRKVFLGEISNWSELGGKDAPIRIAYVGSGGGVTTTVESELLDGKPMSAVDKIAVRTALQLIGVAEQEPNLLAIAQLSLVRQRNLPELTTDRPVEQVLSLVTLGEPTPAMKAVIDAARQAVARTM